MSDKQKQMVEDFAAMVRAIEKTTRPWKIATGVTTLITGVLLIKMALG